MNTILQKYFSNKSSNMMTEIKANNDTLLEAISLVESIKVDRLTAITNFEKAAAKTNVCAKAMLYYLNLLNHHNNEIKESESIVVDLKQKVSKSMAEYESNKYNANHFENLETINVAVNNRNLNKKSEQKVMGLLNAVKYGGLND